MVDASALPPCVTAAMKVSDQPLDSDNGVVGEMVAELKRVLVHGKREGVSSTPTDATPSKSKSEPHVARNLIVDMGLSRYLIIPTFLSSPMPSAELHPRHMGAGPDSCWQWSPNTRCQDAPRGYNAQSLLRGRIGTQ